MLVGERRTERGAADFRPCTAVHEIDDRHRGDLPRPRHSAPDPYATIGIDGNTDARFHVDLVAAERLILKGATDVAEELRPDPIDGRRRHGAGECPVRQLPLLPQQPCGRAAGERGVGRRVGKRRRDPKDAGRRRHTIGATRDQRPRLNGGTDLRTKSLRRHECRGERKDDGRPYDHHQGPAGIIRRR